MENIKTEKINLTKLFFIVTMMPALVIASVFFFSHLNWGHNDAEAMKIGFHFSLGLFLCLVFYFMMFVNDGDIIHISSLAIVIANLALASLIFGLGNTIFLLVLSALGVFFPLANARSLKSQNLKKESPYWFIIFSIICGCGVNIAVGLVLRGGF